MMLNFFERMIGIPVQVKNEYAFLNFSNFVKII